MRIARFKVMQQMRRVGFKSFGELAVAGGIPRPSLSNWFAGAPFSSQSLDALCRALDCTPNDILAWDHLTHPEIVTFLLSGESLRGLAELMARTGQDVNELLATFLENERRQLDLLAQTARHTESRQ